MRSGRGLLIVATVCLVAGLLLLSCVTAGAQEHKPSFAFRALGVATVVLAGVDTAQTADALARPGYHEGNPVLEPVAGHPWALGAVRVGAAVGMNAWTGHLAKTRPRAALWVRVATVALWGTVCALNVRTVKEAR